MISRRAPRHPAASARRSQLSKLNSRDAHSTSQSSCYTACDNVRHSSAAPSTSPQLSPPPPPSLPHLLPQLSAFRHHLLPPLYALGGDLLPRLGGTSSPSFATLLLVKVGGTLQAKCPQGGPPIGREEVPQTGGRRSPKGGEVPPRFPYETAPQYILLLCIPFATFFTGRSRH